MGSSHFVSDADYLLSHSAEPASRHALKLCPLLLASRSQQLPTSVLWMLAACDLAEEVLRLRCAPERPIGSSTARPIPGEECWTTLLLTGAGTKLYESARRPESTENYWS